jgi:acyl-[acyl carrier protein]--UDP-N-acetylglucosamine O-acyltransferase
MKTIDKRFETIFEQEQRLKEEAKKLAEKFKDKKPIKYDLK